MTLGKHQTSLYFQRRLFHSWRASVIITLLLAVTFGILSINVLKAVITKQNYDVYLRKVGDKSSLDDDKVHALTLADYMNQSETAIGVTIYKNFPQDDQFNANVQATIDLCDGQSVYLSYIFEGDIKNDYMNCTFLNYYKGST